MACCRFLRALSWAQALLAVVVIPSSVPAQSPSFLFTVSPGSAAGTLTHFVHADVGYAERVFAAIGAERMEQRLGGQFAAHGADIEDRGNGAADRQRTYQLVREPESITERQFEVQFPEPGVEPFCFTFG